MRRKTHQLRERVKHLFYDKLDKKGSKVTVADIKRAQNHLKEFQELERSLTEPEEADKGDPAVGSDEEHHSDEEPNAMEEADDDDVSAAVPSKVRPFPMNLKLPQFDSSSTGASATAHLETLEVLLDGYSVDARHLPRALMLSVPTVNDAQWVRSEIVQAGVSWEEAKVMFSRHFNRGNMRRLNLQSLMRCKHHAGETIANYSNRFLGCYKHANAQAQDWAAETFIMGLPGALREVLEQRITGLEIVDSKDVSMDLNKVMKMAIALDQPRPTSSQRQHDDKGPKSASRVVTQCEYCGIKGHSTKDCRKRRRDRSESKPLFESKSQGSSAAASFTSSRSTAATDACGFCGKKNHKQEDCYVRRNAMAMESKHNSMKPTKGPALSAVSVDEPDKPRLAVMEPTIPPLPQSSLAPVSAMGLGDPRIYVTVYIQGHEAMALVTRVPPAGSGQPLRRSDRCHDYSSRRHDPGRHTVQPLPCGADRAHAHQP